jgi:hypothetical protein
MMKGCIYTEMNEPHEFVPVTTVFDHYTNFNLISILTGAKNYSKIPPMCSHPRGKLPCHLPPELVRVGLTRLIDLSYVSLDEILNYRWDLSLCINHDDVSINQTYVNTKWMSDEDAESEKMMSISPTLGHSCKDFLDTIVADMIHHCRRLEYIETMKRNSTNLLIGMYDEKSPLSIIDPQTLKTIFNFSSKMGPLKPLYTKRTYLLYGFIMEVYPLIVSKI